MEDVAAGMTRYTVKSKFGMGRDFEVLDAQDRRAFFVDGKMGLKPTADVQDATGNIVLKIEGKFLGIPRRITITQPDGTHVLSAKAKFFTPGWSEMNLELHDGETWHLTGNFVGKNYSVSSGERPVMAISQQLLKLRDTFVLDVADDVDQALAVAVTWTMDALIEQK